MGGPKEGIASQKTKKPAPASSKNRGGAGTTAAHRRASRPNQIPRGDILKAAFFAVIVATVAGLTYSWWTSNSPTSRRFRTGEQDEILATLEKYRSAYQNAANDLQGDAAEDQRSRDICQQLPSRSINDWHGKIASLDTDFLNNVHIKIDLGQNYTLVNRDRIAKYSEIWKNLVSHRVGDEVFFGGRFFCRASNLTQSLRMSKPTFLVTFDYIQ